MIVAAKQQLKMLSSAEMHLLHAGSCELLSRVGVRVTHTGIAKMLLERGAQRRGERILLSRELVEGALAQSARSIHFGAPDPAYSFTINGADNRVKFGTGGQALYLVQRTSNGWAKKPAGTEDLRKIVALCNQLHQVDFITRPVECDLPDDQKDVAKAKIFRQFCTKPMNLANLFKPERLESVLEIVGDPAYLSFIVSLVSSPLTMDSSAGEKLLALVQKDIPVAISSCPQGGTTAPFSEVGELLQLNAELLFGLVLANSARPGARVLYRGIPVTANLHSDASPRWCQPDSIRRLALAAQICRFYNLPCCGTAGVSDEAEPTAQGLSEKVLSWVYEAACGGQYINSALGMLEQVVSVAYYQYVLDDYALKLVKEKFRKNPSLEASQLVLNAALEVLSCFGVQPEEKTEAELLARIRHVENALEPYEEAYMEKQLEIIEKAVHQGSSTVFIKAARKGLREGYLYRGKKIEAPLDLSVVEERLAQGRLAEKNF